MKIKRKWLNQPDYQINRKIEEQKIFKKNFWNKLIMNN